MTAIKPFQRHLPLEGCSNLRELGGYKTTDDREIKWRTLLRSDSLHRLPISSQQRLIDYGIKTIIDLRSPFEIGRETYPFSQRSEINYLNLPLIDENQRNIIEAIKSKTLLELNCFILQERSQAIKTILETMTSLPTPLVIHCAVGKDRTGIIIALLLAIAGIPLTTIAEDYYLSDRYLAAMHDRMRPQAEKEGFTHLLLSAPQTVIDTFAYLDRTYGGLDSYLQSIDLDPLTSDRLKKIFLIDSPSLSSSNAKFI